jgi:hypothetical protein
MKNLAGMSVGSKIVVAGAVVASVGGAAVMVNHQRAGVSPAEALKRFQSGKATEIVINVQKISPNEQHLLNEPLLPGGTITLRDLLHDDAHVNDMIVDRDLVTKLEALIAKVKESCPDAQPVISSGYRTRAENRAKGNSRPEVDAHVRGKGVDLLFTSPGHDIMSLPMAQGVAGIAHDIGFTGIEIDKGGGYGVHVDVQTAHVSGPTWYAVPGPAGGYKTVGWKDVEDEWKPLGDLSGTWSASFFGNKIRIVLTPVGGDHSSYTIHISPETDSFWSPLMKSGDHYVATMNPPRGEFSPKAGTEGRTWSYSGRDQLIIRDCCGDTTATLKEIETFNPGSSIGAAAEYEAKMRAGVTSPLTRVKR